jgi:2-oxo-3-hexenedioate decarboxylase
MFYLELQIRARICTVPPMTNPLSPSHIVELSQTLHRARREAREVEPLTKTHQDFSLGDAYKIQAQGVELRQKEGEKIAGYKMGFTSKAKMEQMGLHQPIFGVLTDKMKVENQGTFSLKNRIHPKTEPEVYFITNKELKGSITREEALAACSVIGVALEILDSRFTGFKYFTLPDVVADNASSAFFVLGDGVQPTKDIDFKNLKISLLENDIPLFEATTAAILGDPLLSLCELVTLQAERGLTLPAGSVVLAGAATQAVELKPGAKMSATLEKVGRVDFVVEK